MLQVPRPAPHAVQRGASLLEALIAFLVLSLGLVAIARLQGQLRLNADLARQQSEATRLAQSDLETLRGFATLSTAAAGPVFADIVAHSASVDAGNGLPLNARFELDRAVQSDDGFRSAALTVRWHDRTGQVRQVQLQSLLSATPPALSGALAVQAPVQRVARLRGRSATIPLAATDLGDGRSALKPVAGDPAVWVFDNTTGLLIERCTVHANAPPPSAVALSGCTAMPALLLAGVVRRSHAGVADAARAHDPPLPLSVRLVLSGGPYPALPRCASEAQKLVAIASGTGVRRLAVPADALPADWGAAAWTELDDRFVAYHCAVTPLRGTWSGRTAIVPQGWRIGSSATDWKVCRYAADQDGSGAVDQNAEHPDEYHHVDRALMQQNFLLVPGDGNCPATPGRPELSTVQHQP